jgi:serine/threonine-protein kinase
MFELNLQRAVLNDRYEIKGRINSGSYAEVFVARDRDSGNVVVIKALNSQLQGPPLPQLEEMLNAKFLSEAVILESVRHPNVVSILDQGDGQDRSGRKFHFIALEFMAGGDLMEHKRTMQEQKLGLAETLFYFKQICDGLAYAHAWVLSIAISSRRICCSAPIGELSRSLILASPRRMAPNTR